MPFHSSKVNRNDDKHLGEVKHWSSPFEVCAAFTAHPTHLSAMHLFTHMHSGRVNPQSLSSEPLFTRFVVVNYCNVHLFVIFLFKSGTSGTYVQLNVANYSRCSLVWATIKAVLQATFQAQERRYETWKLHNFKGRPTQTWWNSGKFEYIIIELSPLNYTMKETLNVAGMSLSNVVAHWIRTGFQSWNAKIQKSWMEQIPENGMRHLCLSNAFVMHVVLTSDSLRNREDKWNNYNRNYVVEQAISWRMDSYYR